MYKQNLNKCINDQMIIIINTFIVFTCFLFIACSNHTKPKILLNRNNHQNISKDNMEDETYQDFKKYSTYQKNILVSISQKIIVEKNDEIVCVLQKGQNFRLNYLNYDNDLIKIQTVSPIKECGGSTFLIPADSLDIVYNEINSNKDSINGQKKGQKQEQRRYYNNDLESDRPWYYEHTNNHQHQTEYLTDFIEYYKAPVKNYGDYHLAVELVNEKTEVFRKYYNKTNKVFNKYFPLYAFPLADYTIEGREFGAARKYGRLHAGNDLLEHAGNPVYAVADGKILDYYPFTQGTDAIVVDHFDFVTLYGEVSSKNHAIGEYVKAGERIGTVGTLKNSGNSMLHFELYTGELQGGLWQPDNPPFQRRADLISPTALIRSLENNYPDYY